MGMCAKSLTNGMNVAAPRAKRHGNQVFKSRQDESVQDE